MSHGCGSNSRQKPSLRAANPGSAIESVEHNTSFKFVLLGISLRSMGLVRHKRFWRGRLIDKHPKHSNLPDGLAELLEVNWFLNVGAHS